MFIIGAAFRFFSYIALEIISSPKRIKMGKKKHGAKTLLPAVSIPIVPGSAQMINPTYSRNDQSNSQNNNQYNSNYPVQEI